MLYFCVSITFQPTSFDEAGFAPKIKTVFNCIRMPNFVFYFLYFLPFILKFFTAGE
jgi:hypothetical protein